MAVGAAPRSWRDRLERLDRGLTWAVGLIQVGVLAYAIWGPSGPSESVATLIALAAMGILGVGTLYQVWHFRRWTLTGAALALTWIGLAAIEAWPLLDPGTQASNSLYVLWQMGATFVLWSILTWRLIYRDAGLSHLVLTLTLMAAGSTDVVPGISSESFSAPWDSKFEMMAPPPNDFRMHSAYCWPVKSTCCVGCTSA